MTQPAKPPATGQKVSLADLTHIPRTDQSGLSVLSGGPSIVSFKEGRFNFDFIWQPKTNAKRLYIFFAGDADRTKREPPVFHRWKWARKFNGHCLFVSDPTLFLERTMGLGWYVGTETFDCLDVIAPLVDDLAVVCGIARRDVIAYGSSGGGFAALRLGERLPGVTVVAINPQTDITAYHGRAADKFLRVCFSNRTRELSRKEFTDRLVLGKPDSPLHYSRVFYAQNDVDTHHHDVHFLPFCARMGLEPTVTTDMFQPIPFSDPAGHGRAETPEVLAEILHRIEQP